MKYFLRITSSVFLFFILLHSCSAEETIDVDCGPRMPSVLTVGQWNVFMFGISDDNIGISDETYEENFLRLKSLIDSLHSDILFLNEYNSFLDANKRHITRDELLTDYQFFSEGGFYCAIASIFPINTREVKLCSRSILLGSIHFSDDSIGIACIHPIPDFDNNSIDERLETHNKVVELLQPYKKAIVAGDFNTKSNMELEPYRDACFIFCNRGDFGDIVTHPASNRSIDNIMIRGFSLLSYQVVDDSSVSDHYPSIATIKNNINN